MSKIALIRLGPTASAEIMNSDLEKRTLYGRVRMLPQGANVVIDHDEHRSIGRVLDVFEMDDVVHGVRSRWVTARARIDDDKRPGWLKIGTGASISMLPLSKSEWFGWPITRDGALEEVTVCSPDTRPIEPCAKVLSLRDEEIPMLSGRPREVVPIVAATPPALPARRRSRDQREMDELRRRLDAAGPGADFELILEALRQELGYGSSVPWWRAA